MSDFRFHYTSECVFVKNDLILLKRCKLNTIIIDLVLPLNWIEFLYISNNTQCLNIFNESVNCAFRDELEANDHSSISSTGSLLHTHMHLHIIYNIWVLHICSKCSIDL